MKLESQVCSLELAKRLKELGINQKSLFYWVGVELNNIIGFGLTYFLNLYQENDKFKYIYSSFTVAELGEMLPNYITTPDSEPFNGFRIFINKFFSIDERLIKTNNWIVNYECDSTECSGENAWMKRKLTTNIYDPNLANAMAKMLIFLIESKLINV